MPGSWRDEFNAGRAAVHAAASRGRPAPDRLLLRRAEPQFGWSPGTAGPASETDTLRALVAELRELGLASQARIAELESELTATNLRAERLAEALETPGARRALQRLFHPDAHAGASDEQLRALNDAASKVNVAYDLIDRAKNTDF